VLTEARSLKAVSGTRIWAPETVPGFPAQIEESGIFVWEYIGLPSLDIHKCFPDLLFLEGFGFHAGIVGCLSLNKHVLLSLGKPFCLQRVIGQEPKHNSRPENGEGAKC